MTKNLQNISFLKLKSINSKYFYKHIKSIMKKFSDGELDGIIYVNMLGEGFNLPNLKIVAINSSQKSLEVTL